MWLDAMCVRLANKSTRRFEPCVLIRIGAPSWVSQVPLLELGRGAEVNEA